MTTWWRWTLALLLCGVGAVTLGPSPAVAAPAVPTVSAGVGTVVADLGEVPSYGGEPGFSSDGAYYAFLQPADDLCELALYDVGRRTTVALAHGHVSCDPFVISWAGATNTLQWQVKVAVGEVEVYAWDAVDGNVSRLAADGHVYRARGVSADGRYFAFDGRSETHPAPGVDGPRDAAYVFDRRTGVSLPLSRPDLHVQLVGWSPKGANFVAQTGGHTSSDEKTGACLGTGTTCRVYTDVPFRYDAEWSRDGTAVIGGVSPNILFDVIGQKFRSFPKTVGYVGNAHFVGPGSHLLLGNIAHGGTATWDRTRGRVTKTSDVGRAVASPSGGYLLVADEPRPEDYRYVNLGTGGSAAATFRGYGANGDLYGDWAVDGASYLGLGPGGCSSLRQWSPSSNTVSLLGPPPPGHCYRRAFYAFREPRSSPSGRFALAATVTTSGSGDGLQYVVDLHRHVLLGPVRGSAQRFGPAGSDLLVVRQPLTADTNRLLLVDPTPVPDVDDKPRWSPATPTNGARVEVAPGGRVQVELGASEPQGAPVNLFFRWRDSAGVPIKSAPRGWSCDRQRLAAGATRAVCTFAPPVRDWTATRFLDVSVTNDATGAQSYKVAVRR